jgi:hypothetical protein
MKRISYGVLVLFVFVQAAIGAGSELGDVDDLIQENLFRNAEKIEEISGTLSDIERFTIFSKYEKNPVLPFVANLAVGFGVGSFFQGDIAGAVIALIGDCLGAGLPILGYACIMQDYYGYWDSPYGYELIYMGYAFLGITRIFESIRPFSYARRYNSTLRRVLRYSKAPNLSLIPSQDTIGVTLAMFYPL